MNFFCSFLIASDETAVLPYTEEGIERHSFSVYVMCKHSGLNKRKLPEYGFTGIKSFPLKVKEYTFSARYMDKMNDKIKLQAEKLQLSLPEKHRKNAVYLADAVFGYIRDNISSRYAAPVLAENLHKAYYGAHEVLEKKQGNALEKARLAVALMRSYQIPARISGYRGSYAVEYYIKPMKGKGEWHVMIPDSECLTCNSGYNYDFEEAVEWYPVDKNELLYVELKEGKAFFEVKGTEDKCVYGGDEQIIKIFDDYVSGIEPASLTVCAKKSFLIRRYDFDIYIPEKYEQKIKADITLPFNNRDILKTGEEGLFVTGRYAVKTQKGLKAAYKRAHTRQNPPQDGMVYYLTVVFEKEHP